MQRDNPQRDDKPDEKTRAERESRRENQVSKQGAADPCPGGERVEQSENYSAQVDFPGTPCDVEKPQEYVSAPQPSEGDPQSAECGVRNAECEVAEGKQPGRPPVLDKFTRAKIVGLIAGGISQRTAAFYVRIHPSTISKAIKRDAAFRKEIRHAQAAAQVLPLIRVVNASEKSWRAAAWLIKNMNPTTDLTERDDRRQARQRARKIEAAQPTNQESAANAIDWLDCVSHEIEKRHQAKQPPTTEFPPEP